MVGKTGKPSIVIDKSYNIWIGNESESVATWSGIELFGFNTGIFELKIVRGENRRDVAGIAWRLYSDLDLVSWEKKITPVCRFMHSCAVSHGLADVAIMEHDIAPKMHPAVSRHISKQFDSPFKKMLIHCSSK